MSTTTPGVQLVEHLSGLVRELSNLGWRAWGVEASSAAIEQIASAERVMNMLVAGANGGADAYAAAVAEVSELLHRPTAAEVKALAAAVEPSTQHAGVEEVEKVLLHRLGGANWVESIRPTRSYWSADTARRWCQRAVEHEPRFAAAFGLPHPGDQTTVAAAETEDVEGVVDVT